MSIVSTVLSYRGFRLQIIRILFSQSISCKIWKSNNIYEHRLLLLLLIHHFFHHLSMKVKGKQMYQTYDRRNIYINIKTNRLWLYFLMLNAFCLQLTHTQMQL